MVPVDYLAAVHLHGFFYAVLGHRLVKFCHVLTVMRVDSIVNVIPGHTPVSRRKPFRELRGRKMPSGTHNSYLL